MVLRYRIESEVEEGQRFWWVRIIHGSRGQYEQYWRFHTWAQAARWLQWKHGQITEYQRRRDAVLRSQTLPNGL